MRIFLVASLLVAGWARGGSAQVAEVSPEWLLDGRFHDWLGVAPSYQRPSARVDSSRTTVERVWVRDDPSYLILRVRLSREILLQADNVLVLYIDTDSDSSTELEGAPAGFDLEWRFGARRGRWWSDGELREIEHQDIGLVTAPTFSSAEFEIALDRTSRSFGEEVFSDQRIKVLLGHEETVHYSPPIEYWLTGADSTGYPSRNLEKQNPEHLRVLSYNLNDRLLHPSKRDALGRIFRAVAADLILLQELRSNSAREAALFVGGLLNADPAMWHLAKVGGEHTVLLSPYPILGAHSLGESGAFLLDLEERYRSELLVVGLSAPCCDEHQRRQEEYDRIMAFVREAKEGRGPLALEPGTPMLFIGDANLVGYEQNLRTLLRGEIQETAAYGPGTLPDWDASPLTDLVVRHAHGPFTFTWYGHDYSPGRLDYAVISDSVLEIGNRFVLYTPHFPDRMLRRYGLRSSDTDVGSDHLPLVVDLVLK